jgi:flagellar basal-body rod protein FlgF
MVYGIYQSAVGLQVNQYRQEVLANNLANLETTGFKQDLAVVRERPIAARERSGSGGSDRALSGMTGGAYVSPTYTSFAQGALKHTGGRLDVAIQGDGFIAVRDGEATRYTRDGRLLVDADGHLVTASGHQVLGEDEAPIVVPANLAQKVTLGGDGEVRAGQMKLGKLSLVDFEDKGRLSKVGANAFSADGGAVQREPQASLQVGFVESSSIEPTQAMVSMIEVSRAYELNATMLGLADSTLSRAVNDLARLP